jgi:hypothetical protein
MKMNVFEKGIWQDFMNVECKWQEDYERLYQFIAFDNFEYGQYKGNQYIVRKVNINHIQLEDILETEKVNKPTIYSYKKDQFLTLMEQHRKDSVHL